MRMLRQILGDRVAGGVTAALAGYFLLLQAFVAAFTCGMTVPADAGPQFVLCQPSQPQGTAAEPGEDTAGFSHDCPCVVCPASDVDLALGLPPENDLGPAFALLAFSPVALFDDAPAPVDPARLGLAPAPRGPPHLSA